MLYQHIPWSQFQLFLQFSEWLAHDAWQT